MAAPSYSPSPTPTRQNHSSYTGVRAASSAYSDISPPDSPPDYYGHRHMEGSPDVSPVDESPKTSQYQLPLRTRYSSNIPLPLRTQNGTKGFLSTWRGRNEGSSPSERDSTLTRWDDFSGEPTTREDGKPAQVTPGNAPFSASLDRPPTDPRFGNRTSISAGPLNSHLAVQNASGPSRNSSGGPRGPREAWKGASGRSAIVSPLVEKLRPASKSIPVPARHLGPASPVQAERTIHATPFPLSDSAVQPQGSFTASPYEDENIKPIVPLKAGRNSPPRGLTTPFVQQAERPYPSPAASDTKSPAALSVSSESARNKPLPTPTYITPSNHQKGETAATNEKEFIEAMHDMNMSNEPGSRFSATTYATTSYESPPDTPRMDFETPMPSPLSPLVNRKRPVQDGSGFSIKSTTRKPTPLERGSSPRIDSSRFSKTLPQSPAEKQSVDRISSLLASQENLRRRRLNLHTVIRELTNVVQPSSPAYDMASRDEIKKTVKALEAELAGVIKEEHETGMKLHRAYKKRDNDDIWEPTGFWVRRVTG